MTTAATSLLGLALPVTGELSGTWGDTVNNSITSLLDTAVAGTTTLSTDGDVTLSTTTLAANQARQAILLCSGARTAIRTITAPAQSKIYTIINATTGGYAVKLVGVGPTTGLTIPNGASAVVAWNGSDFIEIGSSTIGNLTVNGNLTVTGTTTLSGGTANGVAYLNGSKVLTTGSALTFDGTNFGVGGAALSLPAGYTVSQVSGTSGAGLFRATSTSVDVRFQADQVGAVGLINVASNHPLAFNVNASEGMRLTSTGLGIGTTSPTDQLTLYGGKLRISNSTTTTSSGLVIGTNAGDAYISNQYNGYILFGTNNTERMRLDSSGNLGLGVTPSAWNAGGNTQVAAAKNIASAGNGLYVGSNYFYSTGFKYTASSYASYYSQESGVHAWFNAPSGTAGTAISFTQAMTLDASGNLGVGVTSPAWKLDVNGAIASRSDSLSGLRFQTTANGYNGYVLYETSSNSILINNYNAGPITFKTSDTERFRIDSSGAWGLSGANYGTSGQVLTSNGSGTAPTWQSAGGSAATPTALGTVYGKMTTSGASPYLTAAGYNAGTNTTGIHNTVVGYNVLNTNTTGTYNTGVGSQALTSATGSRNTAVGATVMRVTTGSENIGVGTEDAAGGYSPLWSNTSGSYNIAIGNGALGKNTTASNNTAVGYQAGYSNTTGARNVAIGQSALYSNTTASYNTIVGYEAAYFANRTADANAYITAIGYQAGAQVSTGTYSVFVGSRITTNGSALTGNYNTCVGDAAGYSLSGAADSNTLIGQTAGNAVTTATNNTFVGQQAGGAVTTGSGNTIIGKSNGNTGTNNLTTGTNNTFLGYYCNSASASANYQIVIGSEVTSQNSGGYVTIGDYSAKIYCYFRGGATWTQVSDATMKNVIGPDTLGLSFINRLNPVKFTWKDIGDLPTDHPRYDARGGGDSTTVVHGLIAQEVKAALDAEGCSTFNGWDEGPDGIQAISRDMFITPLIKAIQELNAKVEAQAAEIAALKANNP